MDPATIERLCKEALQRIHYYIARSAGQHQRAMREKYEKERIYGQIERRSV